MKNGAMLYDDGRIACSPTSLLIRGYFPWGGTKTIPYASIRSVTERQMGALTGRWRIWGTGDFVHWWNLDPTRPRKQVALEVDVGRRARPMITPDDPETVSRILTERLAR